VNGRFAQAGVIVTSQLQGHRRRLPPQHPALPVIRTRCPPGREAVVAWPRAGLACPHRAWRRAVAQLSLRPAVWRNASPGPESGCLASTGGQGSGPGRRPEPGLRLAGDAGPVGRRPAEEPRPLPC